MSSDESSRKRPLKSTTMDMLTSKDWVAEYTQSHVEIDINQVRVFAEEESDSENEEHDKVPALLESEGRPKARPPVPITDWDKEYNTMFGVVFANGSASQNNAEVLRPASAVLTPHSTSTDAVLAGTSLDLVSSSLDVQTGNASLDWSIQQAIERSIVQAQQQKKQQRGGARRKKEPHVLVYVEHPTELDVLLGRGGRSNHHRGNKRYRDEVGNLQQWYKSSPKNEKTDLSQCLVNYVHSYGGRFLKLDATNKWYIVTNLVARRKASQALREHATPEERAARRALLQAATAAVVKANE